MRRGGKDRPPRVKAPPVKFMANADPRPAQEQLLANPAALAFPSRKHPLQARRTKLAVLGIPSSVLDQGSPEYARTIRLANAYKKARTKELFLAHGYVSSGASALLAAASLALAASRFLYEIAARTSVSPDETGGLTMPQILKLASGLSDSYRQNELSAWELCAREGVVAKRNAQNSVSVPWFADQPSPDGQVKRGPGRPRKVQQVMEVQDAGTIGDGEIEGGSAEGSELSQFNPGGQEG